jgi:hypothetical protein
MKRRYIMMSLLIQGPKQPGNDIDVYLAPLIDDMKMLWSSGAEVYDAYTGEHFNLRAMIYCTISDFPAYGNLSGYGTKGAKACPVCEDDTRIIEDIFHMITRIVRKKRYSMVKQRTEKQGYRYEEQPYIPVLKN